MPSLKLIMHPTSLLHKLPLVRLTEMPTLIANMHPTSYVCTSALPPRAVKRGLSQKLVTTFYINRDAHADRDVHQLVTIGCFIRAAKLDEQCNACSPEQKASAVPSADHLSGKFLCNGPHHSYHKIWMDRTTCIDTRCSRHGPPVAMVFCCCATSQRAHRSRNCNQIGLV